MRQIRSFDTKLDYLDDTTVVAPSIIYIRESGESRDVFEVAPPDSQLYTAVGFYNSENKLTTQILEIFDNSYVLHSGYSGLVTFNEFKYFTGVTELWAGYFSLMSTSLEEITLPKSLTTIRGGAFIGCDLLDKLIIPDKVTVFESGALTGCTGLTELVLGNGITSLNDKMVDQVPNLMKLVIRNKALFGMSDTDDPSTFDYGKCPYFKGLQFVTDVVVDGYQLTSSQIEDLTITRKGYYFIPQKKQGVLVATFFSSVGNNSVMITGNHANWNNTFSRIYLEDGTILASSGSESGTIIINLSPGERKTIYYELKDKTQLGTYSFLECHELVSVIIPNSVTSIGSGSFAACENLTEIEIPDSVTSVGENAFDETGWYSNQLDGLVYAGKVVYKYKGTMPNNTSIVLEEGTKGIAEYTFWNGSSLTSITIPNSVTSIGNYSFARNSSLTSITFGNGVISIGDHAFDSCSALSSVTIPSSVTSIGGSTFTDCTGLTSITCLATTPPTLGDTSTFYNTNACPIYVPSGSVNAYKSATRWSEYSSRIQPIP